MQENVRIEYPKGIKTASVLLIDAVLFVVYWFVLQLLFGFLFGFFIGLFGEGFGWNEFQIDMFIDKYSYIVSIITLVLVIVATAMSPKHLYFTVKKEKPDNQQTDNKLENEPSNES